MKKHYLAALLLVLITGCATYEAKYATPFNNTDVSTDKEIEHTFYLIGDAGKSPMGDMNGTLKEFKGRLQKANKKSTVLFLMLNDLLG